MKSAKPMKPAKPTRPAKPTKPTKPAKPEPPEPQATATPPAKATRDVRSTLETVIVRKQPGEKQAAVATLPTGTEVLVEAEEGRWLRVRAGKVSGYLARTTVTDPPAPPPAPPEPTVEAAAAPAPAPEPGKTSTWSAARRLDPAKAPLTELYVEVTAEASSLRAEARPEAGIVARVARGARLAVAEVNDAAGWLRARDDAGNTGWIARGEVGNGTAAIVAADAPGELAASRASATPGRSAPADRRAFLLRADAGIGYRTFGMDFQSNGSAGLANYLVASSASAADLGSRGRHPAGGEVAVRRRRAGPAQPLVARHRLSRPHGTSRQDRLRHVRRGRRRARGRAHAEPVRALRCAAAATTTPSWRGTSRTRAGCRANGCSGRPLGARADITPPRSRVSATLRVDALVLGSRRQTPGLEDGTDSGVRAVWAGATLRVRFARRLSLLAAYDFGRVSTRWSGMSVREPGVTAALRRSTRSQLVQVGLGAEM